MTGCGIVSQRGTAVAGNTLARRSFAIASLSNLHKHDDWPAMWQVIALAGGTDRAVHVGAGTCVQ